MRSNGPSRARGGRASVFGTEGRGDGRLVVQPDARSTRVCRSGAEMRLLEGSVACPAEVARGARFVRPAGATERVRACGQR